MYTIYALAAKRADIIAKMAGNMPDEKMSILVDELYAVERAIIAAQTMTHAEMAIKTQMLAEKLSDQGGYDFLIPAIIARLARDLQDVRAAEDLIMSRAA